jgi:SAM-dependent methyltransferase
MPKWSKESWLHPYIEGRRVLDLGCVCHKLDRPDIPLLHDFIRTHAESVLGVDCLTDAVAEMKQQGYNVVCADVEKMDLGDTFDVITAGDIIEHLNSPGRFLARCAAHLEPGGLLLVTTPNPVTFERWMRVLVSGTIDCNKEHTCWFTARVLRQLAERFGFVISDESYVNDTLRYHPIYRPQPRRKGTLRWLLRTCDYTLKGLLWSPVVGMQTLTALLRPAASETLCMALQKTDRPVAGKPSPAT